MLHNEDSRVKIPCILHLVRLGYDYLSLKDYSNQSIIFDADTNIFTNLFIENIKRLNPSYEEHDVYQVLADVKLALENDDLGESFYKLITDCSGIKLIDFENFNNNDLKVVTELTYKNGDDEFRPDITLLINGMPLIFIEVKKPNNREGILAERNRINARFQNKKFKRFVNITQLIIFSNNMEYDNQAILPIQGAFYASASYDKPVFNYFREEEIFDLDLLLRPEDDIIENKILKDNNLNVIKHSSEFITNKSPQSPTNRICTSLLNPQRLSFIIKYALTYVRENQNLQKHIMRYPQIFATKAIEKTLDKGIKKGIIWHTQGSGKTALSYYNVRYLKDYFYKKGIVPKFYFIVDRIDLLVQAQKEFLSRGLDVHIINSRDEFKNDIKSSSVIHNLSGKAEITVVNIQKFIDDNDICQASDYDLSIQRVYFLDEVHRSYNPKGSFLANLASSDRNAIQIGLTGTPLLGETHNSRAIFGDYIHKYYYNASIADGYTLRLIREEITSNYKLILQDILEKIDVLKGSIDKSDAYAHENFVAGMLDYIVTDFEQSRISFNDNTIGAMVICDSSKQAKEIHRQFQEEYSKREKKKNTATKSALILHDVGSKQERKDLIDEFKAGNIDFLFVYNMLLTGFDAKRLKKLYIARQIKDHNLLQALTRVNRTYKDFRYGYVVDFADISSEFDKTNKAYFDELQLELGDEFEHYSQLLKSTEEIEQEISDIKDVLFRFDTQNKEEFSKQITLIEDRIKILELKKSLENARSLYNMIRLYNYTDLLDKLDFHILNDLYKQTCDRLELLNLKDKLDNQADMSGLLNTALEDVIFMFQKIGEEELILADELKNTLRQTREAFSSNFDTKDPEFISLREELERLFKNKKLSEVKQSEMTENIVYLNKIHDQIKELNRQNNLLKAKYKHDPKYTRIHKRIIECGDVSQSERQIFDALNAIKEDADEKVVNMTKILDNEGYFQKMMMPLIINHFNHHKMKLNIHASENINNLVVAEYLKEFNNHIE